MTTLLPSSSSSAFSESLHSDTLSEEGILESYPQINEIELERYDEYSDDDDDEALGQETIVITAPPWGQDDQEPVSIIIDEDMNHISLNSKSQSDQYHSHDKIGEGDVKIVHELNIEKTTPFATLNTNGVAPDAVDEYFANQNKNALREIAEESDKSQEAIIKKESKGKGKRQATSDIDENSDIAENRRQVCRGRGGSSSSTVLIGWRNRFDQKQKEEERHHESRRKVILPLRNRKVAAKPYQRDTTERPVIIWQKLVDLPTPESGRNGSIWPVWLHPAFRIESDDHMERLNVKELKNLLKAILESERHYISFRSIFEGIYGPIVCYGRIEEMYETIRAVGIHFQEDDLAEQYCNSDFTDALPLDELHYDDLFIPRYLGNFSSFAAFQQHDQELRKVLPFEVYRALNVRMLNWYRGTGEVDDYQLWGLAKILLLEQNEERALDPDDLLDSDLREWQQRLDNCMTYADAVTVTEEYFGPLSQIDQYEKPRINLDKLWSPCQCNICARSRKRIKVVL